MVSVGHFEACGEHRMWNQMRKSSGRHCIVGNSAQDAKTGWELTAYMRIEREINHT